MTAKQRSLERAALSDYPNPYFGMAVVLEDHIREHAFGGKSAGSAGSRAADELIDVVRSYLR